MGRLAILGLSLGLTLTPVQGDAGKFDPSMDADMNSPRYEHDWEGGEKLEYGEEIEIDLSGIYELSIEF